MKLNRTLVLCLSIVLAASMALGGTLAFLTDTETKVNEFTVGDVDIELNEVFDEENAELIPGTSVEKKVTIKNVGSNTAWVWYTYAVPANMDGVMQEGMLSVYTDNVRNADNPDGEWIDLPFVFDNKTSDHAVVEIDGIKYNVYAALYNSKLAKDEETVVGMSTVSFNSYVDYDPNTEMYYMIENGVQIGAGVPKAEVENAKIIVTAYAIQETGFDTVFEALDAYLGQWGSLESAIQNTLPLATASDLGN